MSLTDVANLALDLIGETPISDISTSQYPENFINRQMTRAIKETQERYAWSDLITTVEVDITDAGEGVDDYFAEPDDCLRVLEVATSVYGVNRSDKVLPDYVRRGKKLYVNYAPETISLTYIKYDNDDSNWSELLLEAIYYRLAIKVCKKITQNTQMHAQLVEEYEKIVKPMVVFLDAKQKQARYYRNTGFSWNLKRKSATGYGGNWR